VRQVVHGAAYLVEVATRAKRSPEAALLPAEFKTAV
jgi:hypothetical protein